MNEQSGEQSGIPARVWVGLAIGLIVVLFIALNRDETSISFILFTALTPLWVALSIAAAGGFVTGFLMGRKRYRP
jgi:uncharacterized integral membrane protein